ncbi:hypothetical protein BHM03_00040729 [Ensete ventricosum]|nr:hypothetical protein BHM03_00040729 [Ensete ventricosum]
MCARVKSEASGRGSDDALGTHRETRQNLAEAIGSLPGVRRELAEGIRAGREFVESLPKVSEACWEFTGACRSNRELARMVSGVHWKKIKRLIGRSLADIEKFTGSQEGLVGLDGHMIVID